VADELQSRGLPPHIEEAVRSIAELHAKHQQTATRLQRAYSAVTSSVASPWFCAALTCVIASWAALNLLAGVLGYEPFDAPPKMSFTSTVPLGVPSLFHNS